MQRSVQLGGAGLGEPKFFHYCYVCNTQLNSCKQALLHCSGKRHRKKLQFLQSRQHSVGHGVSSSLGGNGGGQGRGRSPELPFHPQPFPSLPPYNRFPSQYQPPELQHFLQPPSPHQVPPNLTCNGTIPTGGGRGHFPFPQQAHQQMLSPAAMAGTDGWLRPIPLYPSAHPTHLPLPHHQPPPPHPSHLQPNPQGQVGGYGEGGLGRNFYSRFSTPRSSPVLSTDVSANSSSSDGLRSAVISPSDTSSLSSDHSGPFHCYKCQVCEEHYQSLAQLHSHLYSANHFRSPPPSHPNLGEKRDEEEKTGTTVYYCSVCNLTLNSKQELRVHNAGPEHQKRLLKEGRRKRSPSHPAQDSSSFRSSEESVERRGEEKVSGTSPCHHCASHSLPTRIQALSLSNLRERASLAPRIRQRKEADLNKVRRYSESFEDVLEENNNINHNYSQTHSL